MNENLKCNICLEENKNIIIFSKCKHYICTTCLNKMQKSECPYCRCKFDKELINIKGSINKTLIKSNVTNNNFNNEDFYFEEYEFTEDDKEKFQLELTKEYLNSWYKYFSF